MAETRKADDTAAGTDLHPLTTNPYDDDKLHEECAVFGIWGLPDAAASVALGLHALQHRGQEAAGIVSLDAGTFNSHRSLGLVGDNFVSEEVMGRLRGHAAIGHTRYATTGDTVLRNVQPLFAELSFGGFAVCHNGNYRCQSAHTHHCWRRWCEHRWLPLCWVATAQLAARQ